MSKLDTFKIREGVSTYCQDLECDTNLIEIDALWDADTDTLHYTCHACGLAQYWNNWMEII